MSETVIDAFYNLRDNYTQTQSYPSLFRYIMLYLPVVTQLFFMPKISMSLMPLHSHPLPHTFCNLSVRS